ncbi:MAG: DUF1476 domain-containing protein [Proteobacteria bacterium]|nr:DUF1476 domain-containing protein [Pseudomonadota bacterium]
MDHSSGDGFKDREHSFETKYFHDEELTFRIHAKRNHLFGLWVVSLLGYTDEKADLYIEEIILVDVQRAHKEDVLYKVLKDLEAAKVDISDHRLRKKLEEFEEEARKIIMNDEGF